MNKYTPINELDARQKIACKEITDILIENGVRRWQCIDNDGYSSMVLKIVERIFAIK